MKRKFFETNPNKERNKFLFKYIIIIHKTNLKRYPFHYYFTLDSFFFKTFCWNKKNNNNNFQGKETKQELMTIEKTSSKAQLFSSNQYLYVISKI